MNMILYRYIIDQKVLILAIGLADFSLIKLRNWLIESTITSFLQWGKFNNSFKIIQSSSPINNFAITGIGSTDHPGSNPTDFPAMMFVKGIPVLAIGNFEYNSQNASHTIESDNYTKTLIAGLTTPGSNRTDIVYMDVYFAEVSSE